MNKILCIDIANNNIRCLEVLADKKQSKPNKAISMKLGVEIGSELPTQEDISKFQNELSKAEITAKKAVVFLHTSGLIYRNIEVPVLDKKDLLDYITLNSNDFFPTSIEDYIIDAKVFQKNTQNMQVSVVLVPKTVLADVNETMKLFGFTDIQFAFSSPLAKWLQPEKQHICISILANEINFQYFEDDQMIYTRSEVVEDLNFDARGALVRFDDFLSSQYSQSLYTTQVHLFADESVKNIVTQALNETFNIDFDSSVEGLQAEYGYLIQLPLNTKQGKFDQSNAQFPITAQESQKQLIAIAVLAVSAAVIFVLVLSFGCLIPKANLSELNETYDELYALEQNLSGDSSAAVAMSYSTLIAAMDTANNHFFTLIEELEQTMPSDLVIDSFSITESSVSIDVSLESYQSCSAALEQMDNLVYADAGDVSAISQSGDTYSFSITLTYTSELSE